MIKNDVLDALDIEEAPGNWGLLFIQMTSTAFELYEQGREDHPDRFRPNVRVGTYDVPERHKKDADFIFECFFPDIHEQVGYQDASLVVFKNAPVHVDDPGADYYFLNVILHSEGTALIQAIDGIRPDDSVPVPYELEITEGDVFLLDPRSLHGVHQLTVPDGMTAMLQFKVDRNTYHALI